MWTSILSLISSFKDFNWKIIGWVSLGIGLFLGGCYITSRYYESEIASINASTEEAENIQLQKTLEKNKKYEDIINESNINYENTLKEKNDEIEKLKFAVASGSERLYVKARCPTVSVPNSSSSSSMGVPGDPELTEESRQDYYTLREEIVVVTTQLNECKSILIKNYELSKDDK